MSIYTSLAQKGGTSRVVQVSRSSQVTDF